MRKQKQKQFLQLSLLRSLQLETVNTEVNVTTSMETQSGFLSRLNICPFDCHYSNKEKLLSILKNKRKSSEKVPPDFLRISFTVISRFVF